MVTKFDINDDDFGDNEPTTFWERSGCIPVDMWIRISINPEIGIRIPDHFWLR